MGISDKPVSLQGLAASVANLTGIDEGDTPEQSGGNRFDDSSSHCTVHTCGWDGTSDSMALVFSGGGNVHKIILHADDDDEHYNLTVGPGETDNLSNVEAPEGAIVIDPAERADMRAAAQKDLDLRALQQRAAEWLARGERPDSPLYR